MIASGSQDSGSGGLGTSEAYTFLASQRRFRVNPDNSTTEIVDVSAQSSLYQVQYTWSVLAQEWDDSGPAAVIPLKTGEVNVICGEDHVQNFWTETDQGPSNVLYHFAVITVGTADGSITDEVRVRMDHLSPPPLAQIDAAWQRLAAAGAA